METKNRWSYLQAESLNNREQRPNKETVKQKQVKLIDWVYKGKRDRIKVISMDR